MKSVKSVLTASLLGLALASQASAVVNGSFASGLSGWSTLGDVSAASGSAFLTNASLTFDDDFPTAAGAFNVSGTSAADVAFDSVETFVGLTPGGLDPDAANGIFAFEVSALTQSFTVLAGQTLTFDWKFLTNEGAQPDYAFVVIDGVRTTLAATLDANAPSNPFAFETAVAAYSHTFLSTGTAFIAFGVVDVNDYGVTSALQIDNVQVIPEPGTYAMLIGAAALGLALWRRRE